MWRRVYIIVAVLAVVAVLAAEQYAYHAAEKREARNFMQQELLLAQRAAEAIEALFERTMADLYCHSRVFRQFAIGPEKAQRALEDMYGAHQSHILACGIAHAEGNILHCVPGEIAEQAMPFSPEMFPPAGEGRATSCFEIVPGVKGVAILQNSGKIDDAHREQIFFMLIDLARLSRKCIRPLKLGQTCYAWVLDENGVGLINPHNPARLGKNEYEFCRSTGDEALIELSRRMQNGEEGTGVYKWPGEGKKLLGFAQVRAPGLRWCVGVSASYSQVADQLAALRLSHFGILAVGFLLIGALGVAWYRAERSGVAARQHAQLAEELEKEVKRRTEELSRTSEMLRGVLDCTAAYGVFATDAQGCVTLWSKGAENLTGYSSKEMVGEQLPAEVLLSEEIGNEGFAAFSHRIISERGEGVELTGIRKNGRRFPMFLSLARYRDAKGNAIGYVGVARDITVERKLRTELEDWARRLEEVVEKRTRELRESEEKYRLLVDRASEGIVMADIETRRFIYANSMFCQLLRYSETEILKLKVDDIHPPGSLPELLEKFYSIADGKIGYVPDVPCLRKDGNVIFVHIGGSSLDFEGRKVIQGTFTDVTEQKKVHDALQQSEAKFRALFEGANDGIVIIDAEEGAILDLNPAFERMLGYQKGELIGKRIWELRPEENIGAAKEHFFKLKQHLTQAATEQPFRAKDGRTVQVEFSTRKAEMGGRAVYQSICRDITERKRMEQELESYRSYLESILSSAPAGMNTVDLNGVVQIWGGNSPSMFGYTAEEVVGKMSSADLHADPQEARKVLEIASTEGIFSGEVTLKRKDGRTFPSLLRVAKLMDSQRKHIGYTGFNIDITETKELQDQLLQSQKMESLGRLAGGIAHDFNNILSGIVGYASFLKSRLDQNSPFYGYVDTMEQSGIRAASLTKQLLSFSRGEQHTTMPVDLNKVVKDTMELMPRFLGTNIVVRTKLEPHVFVASVDPTQIEQAILNICINARDAMPKGGELTLRTENVILDEEFARMHRGIRPGPHVLITISDSGVGMGEAVKQKIFEPFFTTKGAGQGTGLGLSIVYSIVKRHRGCIEVESKPEKGTTFKLYLPASMRKSHAPVERPEEDMPGGSEGILVVDDEKTICDLSVNILASLGYKVFTTSSGSEAVEEYRKRASEIDLIILDIIMPGMDGIDTYEALCKINSAVRVLLSSGYALSERAEELLERDRVTFLAKPYTAFGLAQAVRDALDA